MDWFATLALLFIGVALTSFHLIQSRRKKSSFKVALIPPAAILFIGILLILVAGSHALTLLGIEHNRSQLRL